MEEKYTCGVYDIILKVKKTKEPALIVATTYDGEDKAYELAAALQDILDECNETLYVAKARRKEAPHINAGSVSLVSSDDIEYTFKIKIYPSTNRVHLENENDHIVLRPEISGSLKLIETMLTDFKNKIDHNDQLEYICAEELFADITRDFISNVLRSNPFVTSFRVYTSQNN